MTLKKKTYLGLLWVSVDTVFVRAFTFIALIFMARWLGPKEFGILGMIAVFIAVGNMLVDSGMSNSLIRTKVTDESDYSTVFYINLIMSFLVYVLIYFSTPFIADFYDTNLLIPIIRLYCLIFLLSAFSSVQLAILTKNMNFKAITMVNLPSTIIGVGTGLFLAYFNFGVWSIVWMYLMIELIKTILLWFITDWRPKFIFSFDRFRYHYNFGYKLMLSGLIDTIFKNIYNIIIGKFYSVQTLGYYERSKQFSEYPSSTLTGIIGKVTFPILSNLQDSPLKLEIMYKKLIRVSFFLIAPLMLCTASIAKPLFLLVLGVQWLPAVLFFQILSLAMMLYPIHAFNLNILKVYGRSDLFLKLEVIKKIIIVITILFAFQFGVMGLVSSSVFTSFAALGVNMYYSNKLVRYSIIEQIKDLILTFIIAFATALLMFFLIGLISSIIPTLQIAIAITCGIVIYGTFSYLFNRNPLIEALSFVKYRNL